MMHVASYSVPDQPAVAAPKPLVATAKRAPALQRITVAQPATKPVKTATADPLAALPGAKPKAKGDGPAATAGKAQPKHSSRDTGSE